MALGYDWVNIANWAVSKGNATVTFWIDAKLNRQDIGGNYSVVDTRLNSTIVNSLSGSGYNFQLTGSGGIAGSGVWYFGNETILTGQYTVYHNNEGQASSTVSAYAYNKYWSIDHWFSGSFDLPTIPRYAKMTNAIGDFNDEQIPWFDYSNPANSSMSCWLEINPSGEHLCTRNLSGTSGRYTWQLSETERNQLRGKLANASNGKGKIRIGLYSTIGGNTQASYIDRNFTIINANPIFSNFEFEDLNPVTLALTGDSSINVNGYSNIKATISTLNKATAIKEATMSKYQFRAGSSNPLDITYSSDSEVSGIINNAPNGSYNVYAIDSRQNSTLVTKLASSEIAYQPIFIDKQHSKIERTDNQVGEYAKLILNGTIWNNNFGQVTNSITSVTYKFKKTSDNQWVDGTTTIIPTVTDNTFTFENTIASDNQDTTWDLDSSYNIEVTISDELSSSTAEFILNSAIPTLSLDKEGVGVMCAYDRNLGGKLQVDGKNVAYKGTVLYENSSGTNGTITLSDNASNYDFIEIYYHGQSDGAYIGTIYAKVDEPDGKDVELNYFTSSRNHDNIWFKWKVVSISGTSITTKNYVEGNLIGVTLSYQNFIYITKVIGYKED